MIRNPTPYPSPQARRGENSPNLSQARRGVNTSNLSQASRGGNVPLSAGGEGGRGVRFYAVTDEETQ
ncbi:hypothetical protein SAMD00079811_42810 [Scytonema sp. HK-05]|nr:hypothetical protein NIES2130_21160 [Scytonema sp. HK-05]BAY46668.1 hypothetical protein SAMD00079811_42810 [Scytonema sp. HK-05]